MSTLLLTLASVSCGGRSMSGADEEPPLASFVFPGDGVDNANGYVGPFCCTGQTGIVEDPRGAAVGYVYFYSFDDGYNIDGGERLAAGRMAILIAGREDLADANSHLFIDEIRLEADELRPGASKSAKAGALEFEVVIDDAELVVLFGKNYFDMDSVVASVTARAATSLR